MKRARSKWLRHSLKAFLASATLIQATAFVSVSTTRSLPALAYKEHPSLSPDPLDSLGSEQASAFQ
ncbi:hypothetical protein [Fibrella arboris]|uniref:hypothetical protein n=1 Tax=Fibrella arboris TaxID=3242486 RepID=UPI0035216D44